MNAALNAYEPAPAQRAWPKLPVLGWASYSGPRAAPAPGVLDARHRCPTISGRAAIGVALRVLGAGRGARVLVPTYHCPTMISPVVRAGAAPVFYPITATGAPDMAWLAQADLAAVSAMLATHYFGVPQPMAAVRRFCDDRGIALIEDCAHCLFGLSGERPVGSWGDLAITSLMKFFPTPEGGLLVSTSRPLHDIALEPRPWLDQVRSAVDAIEVGALHGRFPGLNTLLGGIFGMKNQLRRAARQKPEAQGTATRDADLDDAFLAHVRPSCAARWIAGSVPRARIVHRRRANYSEYARLFAGMKGARALFPELPEAAAPYVFPLYVDRPGASYQPLRAAGVPIYRWDEVWRGTPMLAGDCGPDWSQRVFQLGCHQDLSTEDIGAIAATTRKIVAGAR